MTAHIEDEHGESSQQSQQPTRSNYAPAANQDIAELASRNQLSHLSTEGDKQTPGVVDSVKIESVGGLAAAGSVDYTLDEEIH